VRVERKTSRSAGDGRGVPSSGKASSNILTIREDMHPWRRLGLAQAEQAPMQQMHGMLLAGDQNEQQTSFRCWQGTVPIGRIASRLPAPSMEGPGGHRVQERCLTGRHQGRKLVHGHARQISDLGGMGWNIAVT
jgi:hypothetical protein